MAKIGEELFIEASQNKLILRTLNSSRSAFLAFTFGLKFFDEYVLEDDIDRKYQVKLKVIINDQTDAKKYAKPCQVVFKQHNNVDKCTMRLDEIEQRLVFELLCKHGK
jgi:hypothetical protein